MSHAKQTKAPLWFAPQPLVAGTSSSSSISFDEKYGFYPTYICTCSDIESINNPITGKNVGMHYLGDFDVVSPDWEIAFDGDDPLKNRGGLSKTTLNQGRLFCQDASNLISMSTGLISLRLCLPYAISNGIYAPIDGETDFYLKHYVLFGVNFGLTRRKFKPLPWWLWVVLAIAPLGLDGVWQLVSQMQFSFLNWLPARESTPFLRVATGAAFGWFTAWFGIPTIEESVREERLRLEAKAAIERQTC